MFLRSIIKLMLLPIVSILIFVGFFTVFLTPQQRSSIFNEVLSRLPVFNNFVDKSFDTRVFGLEEEDSSILKTATWAVDQLILIENREGKKYYAVCPFSIEAGFDLSKATASLKDGIYSIALPAARIVSSDADEKRNLVVIRNDLVDNYEELLQPIKIAYNKKAYDLALASHLLGNAEKNARKFLRDFWKPIYKDVKIEIVPQKNNEFKVFRCERLPFVFNIRKSAAKLTFKIYPNLESFPCCFKDDRGSFCGVFFVDYFSGSRRELREKFESLQNNLSCFISYVDPINPRSMSWIGGIGQSGGFAGVFQVSGNLYGLCCNAVDKVSSLYSKATAIYLLSSIKNDVQVNSAKCEEYKEFVLTKNEAIKALRQKRFSGFSTQARKLYRMDPESQDGTNLYKLSRGIGDGVFLKTGSDFIDCLLKGWISIHYGESEYFDTEVRKKIWGYFVRNNKPALAEFCNYLLERKGSLQLTKMEIDEAENYLIENNILSRKLLANLETEKVHSLFNGWICDKVSSLHKRYGSSDSFHARGLFSDLYYNSNGVSRITWREDTPYPFYDYKALKELHGKGKTTVNKRLSYYEPQNHTVVVVTREGIIFDSYDAFIFYRDYLNVIRGVEDGFESEDVTSVNYANLNIGYDEVTIAGKTYKNTTLFYLLDKLAKIYGSNLQGGNARSFEDIIMDEIIEITSDATWTWEGLAETLED